MATRIAVFMHDPFSPKTRKRRGLKRSSTARRQLERFSMQLTGLMQRSLPNDEPQAPKTTFR